jgi:glycosyltransferase involved in cell wall biosynthesis
VRLAFVTPRYGAEIGSGPEHACRLLAEQVAERHDVDVLTTCARDPRTWSNEYAEEPDRVRGVLVRRFAVSQPGDPEALRALTARLLAAPHGRSDELEWVRRLGPWSPGLLDYLKRQHHAYDVIVFFSLWHPTTVYGLPAAPERSVVFPYLELRPALRFGLWADILSSARALGFVSAWERRLMRLHQRVTGQHEELVGIGIDPAPLQTYPRHQQDPREGLETDETPEGNAEAPAWSYLASRGVLFRRRHRLYGRVVLYGGPVEPDNGCEEMLEYFDTFAARNGDAALVLMGVKLMKVPEEPYIRLAGVLPDRERMIAYEAADVTLAPSPDDLLAQMVLESFAVGTPVLASARNEAAVEHCRRANAGLYYACREEFVEALGVLLGDDQLRQRMGENGRAYVRQHFRWEGVLGRFERLVSRVRAA